MSKKGAKSYPYVETKLVEMSLVRPIRDENTEECLKRQQGLERLGDNKGDVVLDLDKGRRVE